MNKNRWRLIKKVNKNLRNSFLVVYEKNLTKELLFGNKSDSNGGQLIISWNFDLLTLIEKWIRTKSFCVEQEKKNWKIRE